MNRLAIRAADRQVGTLSHDPARNLFDFAYGEDWLRWEDGFPLSPQMPKASDGLEGHKTPFSELAPESRSAIARSFFQNLLPEGQALDVAAQANGLSKANLAGLLLALGAEPSGALSVTLEDAPVTDAFHLNELGASSGQAWSPNATSCQEPWPRGSRP